MNHRKELIWNKFPEQFFYASLKLERNEKLWISIFRGTHFWCASFFYNRVQGVMHDANLRYVSICHSPGVLLLMLMSRYVSHSPGGASIVTHAQFWQLMLTMISLPTFPEYLFHNISEGFDVWRQTEIFFENSISTKKEVVEAGICCHAMLWQILIHPKSGDAGDISPPPIFWIFRQSLGGARGARGTHAMLWQILRLLFSHAVLLQMEVPRLPFFSSWQFVYENWIEIEIALVADLPPPHTPVLTHCAALLCCKPFFPFFLQLTRISHAVLQLTRIKTLIESIVPTRYAAVLLQAGGNIKRRIYNFYPGW